MEHELEDAAPSIRPSKRCQGDLLNVAAPALHLRAKSAGRDESIEGKRGMPRLRQHVCGQVGLFGSRRGASIRDVFWVTVSLVQKGEHGCLHERTAARACGRYRVGRGRAGREASAAGITIQQLSKSTAAQRTVHAVTPT